MLAKDERKAMLLRLFNDDTPLKDRSKDRFAATAQGDASTSTLRGTTAERANVHFMADELAGGEDVPIDEQAENGVDGGEEVPVDEEAGNEVNGEAEMKIGEGGDDEEEVGLDVGGGEGIMKIGGAD